MHGEAGLNFTVTNLGPDAAATVRVLAIFRNRMQYRSMQVSSGGTCTLLDTVTGTLNLVAASAGTADVEFQVATEDIDSDNTNDSTVVPLTIAEQTSTPRTASTSASGGGCVWSPDGPFDPVLLSLLGMGVAGVLARRRRRAAGQLR